MQQEQNQQRQNQEQSLRAVADLREQSSFEFEFVELRTALELLILEKAIEIGSFWQCLKCCCRGTETRGDELKVFAGLCGVIDVLRLDYACKLILCLYYLCRAVRVRIDCRSLKLDICSSN